MPEKPPHTVAAGQSCLITEINRNAVNGDVFVFKSHPNITEANPNARLWRYMDFAKFVSLLDKASLWFAHADTFEDPYDSLYNIEAQIRMLKQSNSPSEFIQFAETIRNYYGISCWNMSEVESAALWKAYVSNKEGIAITTTFGKLSQCFRECPRDVHIGRVSYIANDQPIPMDNTLRLFYHKRTSFQHENEVRAIATDGSSNVNRGFLLRVDLKILLTQIYVTPTSDAWFLDVVKSVMDKYNVSVPLVKSDLYDKRVI